MKLNLLICLMLLAVACNKSTITNNETKLESDSNPITHISGQIEGITAETGDTCNVYRDELDYFFDGDFQDSIYLVLRNKQTPSFQMVDNLYSDIQDSLLTFKVEGGEYLFYKVTHLDKLMVYQIEVDSLTADTKKVMDIGRHIFEKSEMADEGCGVVYIYPEAQMEYLCFMLNGDQIDKMLYVNLIE